MFKKLISLVPILILTGCTTFGEADKYKDYSLQQIEDTNICFYKRIHVNNNDVRFISKQVSCSVFQTPNKIQKSEFNEILIDGFTSFIEDSVHEVKVEEIFDGDEKMNYIKEINKDVYYNVVSFGKFYNKRTDSCYDEIINTKEVSCDL